MEFKDFKLPPECICPLWGGDVEIMTHPTYPPQTHYKCRKCGRHEDIRQEIKSSIAPFK